METCCFFSSSSRLFEAVVGEGAASHAGEREGILREPANGCAPGKTVFLARARAAEVRAEHVRRHRKREGCYRCPSLPRVVREPCASLMFRRLAGSASVFGPRLTQRGWWGGCMARLGAFVSRRSDEGVRGCWPGQARESSAVPLNVREGRSEGVTSTWRTVDSSRMRAVKLLRAERVPRWRTFGMLSPLELALRGARAARASL
ncbi:hypothetical protein B0H13DRAFT_2091920 [Mycena leptocephala]|nr:hypothetical protein B0H13DRAFT_2091920 [Mycena leptocephala]